MMRFQCPECGMGDYEVGHLVAEPVEVTPHPFDRTRFDECRSRPSGRARKPHRNPHDLGRVPCS